MSSHLLRLAARERAWKHAWSKRVSSSSRPALATAALAVLVVASQATTREDEQQQQTRRVPLWETLLYPSFTLCDSPHRSNVVRRRSTTFRDLSQSSTKDHKLEDVYEIDWKAPPIGEGSFGTVHLATDKRTGQKVAIKKIPKQFTSNETFQREMQVLLEIRASGGHPNINALREYFEQPEHYCVVLEYISGGEMFDHLVVCE